MPKPTRPRRAAADADPARIAAALLAVLLAALLPGRSATAVPAARAERAHPFHESFGELELGPDGRSLEIAFEVDAVELEAALRGAGAAEHRLDRPGAATGLEEYLSRRFLVRDDLAGWGRFEWVGFELESASVWCYFRLRFERRVDDFALSNQVLFERNFYQRNRVQVRSMQRMAPLEFTTGGDPWLRVEGLDRAACGLAGPRPTPRRELIIPGSERWWREAGLDWRIELGCGPPARAR